MALAGIELETLVSEPDGHTTPEIYGYLTTDSWRKSYYQNALDRLFFSFT